MYGVTCMTRGAATRVGLAKARRGKGGQMRAVATIVLRNFIAATVCDKNWDALILQSPLRQFYQGTPTRRESRLAQLR